MNTRDLARLGKNGPDQAPPVQLEPVVIGTRSPGGPRTVMTPAGVDPGFGYAPGRSLTLPPPDASSPGAAPPPPAAEQLQGIVASTAQQVIEKTLRLPAPVAARSAAAVLERPRVLQALAADFAQWQVDLVAGSAGTDTFTAGALAPVVVDAAAAAGIELASVAIAARAAQVEATLQAGALIAEDLALPFQLQAPSAVLLDRARGVLLFFAPSQRNPGELVEVTVKLADAGAAHTFDGAVVADLQARRRELQSGALQLLDGEL